MSNILWGGGQPGADGKSAYQVWLDEGNVGTVNDFLIAISAGADGTNGVDGSTILNGTVVPTTEGVDGDFYLRTDTMEIYGPRTAGAWGSPTSLVGNPGVQGPAGNTLLSGTVVPTTQGVDGDFYLKTDTMELYGPKAAGDWGSPKGLTGVQGPAGNTLLSGTATPTTEGSDGDFYYKSTTMEIFGPKTAGAWGVGTSLAGPEGPTGNGTPVEVVADFPVSPTVGTLYVKVV